MILSHDKLVRLTVRLNLSSFFTARSAAASLPSDPQGSGYGLAADDQGQRSKPQAQT